MIFKVLITGCGRSGTTYISKLFQAAGYDVDHERETGDFGTSSWYAVKNRTREYKFILHQLRNPLEVIASMTTANNKSWSFISKNISQISQKDTLLEKCAKYWLYWNKEAEKIADLSYKIEDLPQTISKINKMLDVKIKKNHLDQLSNKVNTRSHIKLNWNILKLKLPKDLYLEVLNYAKKWDYA